MAAPSARPRESFLRRDDQWKAHGACRDVDTERFYLESTRGRTRIELETRAKAICAHCPVVTECRDYALLTREPYGIWGGLTPGDRRGGRGRG